VTFRFSCCVEGGRSYVDDLEDELLSRVGSIGRILEAERLKTAGSLSRHFVGENLAQSTHPEWSNNRAKFCRTTVNFSIAAALNSFPPQIRFLGCAGRVSTIPASTEQVIIYRECVMFFS